MDGKRVEEIIKKLDLDEDDIDELVAIFENKTISDDEKKGLAGFLITMHDEGIEDFFNE